MAQTSARSKQPRRKSSKLSRAIREEAKALQLTEREYYRLTLVLSKTLRTALKDTGMSAKELLALFDSPIVSSLIQTMMSTVVSGLQSNTDTSNDNMAAPSSAQPPHQTDAKRRESATGPNGSPPQPQLQPNFPGYPGYAPPYPPYSPYPPYGVPYGNQPTGARPSQTAPQPLQQSQPQPTQQPHPSPAHLNPFGGLPAEQARPRPGFFG